MPIDPLKAHAMALDAIDELIKIPAVKKYLKPLDSEASIVYHYVCLNCKLNFWTDREINTITYCIACGGESKEVGEETI